MENIISIQDEHKLTRAIEKAASLASIDTNSDRNVLLANILVEDAVPARFAKVAANAFNKRLTVLTFKKTADENRAASFPLADPQKVYNIVAGEKESLSNNAVNKVASIEIVPKTEGLKKSASSTSINLQPKYEDVASIDRFNTHVNGMLDKHAAIYSSYVGKLNSLRTEIDKNKNKISEYFSKDANVDKDLPNAIQYFGSDLSLLISEETINKVPFKKFASKGIYKESYINNLIKSTLSKVAAYKDMYKFIDAYKKELTILSKAAQSFGQDIENIRKNAFLKKQADPLSAIKNLTSLALTSGVTAKNVVETQQTALEGATSDWINNILAFKNAAGGSKGEYSKALDADFLTNDRMRDRLLAWSDLSADPILASYPSEEVFMAAANIMNTSPKMEEASNRNLLKANVTQYLLQNSRLSTADIAALSTILESVEKAGDSNVEKSYSDVVAKGTKKPDSTISSFTLLKSPKLHTSSIVKGSDKMLASNNNTKKD